MKLLTFNTHSLHGENQIANCHILCEKIEKERPDIIALQEVNQYAENPHTIAPDYIPVGETPIKESNFSVSMQKILVARKLKYQFSWLGMKRGYDRFDEGLAIFSKEHVKEAKSLLLSNTSDYNNFKKRMALLVETESGIFVNCHMGWENDSEEPFDDQLRRLGACNNFKKNVYLMGDFNVVPKSKSYNNIINSGWYDTFFLANEISGEATVSGEIDGWRENGENIRIDYIFSNKKMDIKRSETLFDGVKTPKISDHFAVMVTS